MDLSESYELDVTASLINATRADDVTEYPATDQPSVDHITTSIVEGTTQLVPECSDPDGEWQSFVECNRELIGILLAISGGIIIAVSLSLQKYSHNKLKLKGKEDTLDYLKSPMWWLGMVLMGVGELMNFLAFGFAPAALVTPLGCIAVLLNALIAVIFLDEKCTKNIIFGVVIITVSAVVLIIFAPKDDATPNAEQIQDYFTNWMFIVYFVVEILLIALLFYLKWFHNVEHLLLLLLLVAMLASFTIIASKIVSTYLNQMVLLHTGDLLKQPEFWISLAVLPITTIAQINLLNRAMQLYDVSVVVPVNFIFFTISGILAGAIFYQEFVGETAADIGGFVGGCLVSFIGVIVIACKEQQLKNTMICCFPCCCKHILKDGYDKIETSEDSEE